MTDNQEIAATTAALAIETLPPSPREPAPEPPIAKETAMPEETKNEEEPENNLLPAEPAGREDVEPPPPRHILPYDLPGSSPPVLSQYGVAYVVVGDKDNPHVLMVGSKQLNNILRGMAIAKGMTLKRQDLNDMNEDLKAYAEMSGGIHNVWSRVAPIDGGIEIDMADEGNNRIQVTAGKVDIIKEGSKTLFYRNPVSQPMVMPAGHGDLELLKKYVNLSSLDLTLFVAWLSYTLVHPKVNSSKYVHLVLQGDQGTGKSFVCSSIIISLLDPSRLGVQVFPSNAKDLTIAAQHAHVLCYDNLRGFKSQMADILCMASTGGTISNRALYTDADQHLYNLHAPLVLNGIHSFINQSDLAQRCLSIRTLPMPESQRKSEADMLKELETDLPVILRGLLDLVAAVLEARPHAEVTHPERMYDFVRWLAAMEKARKVPAGVYQGAYSAVLHEAQLDSLMENLLSSMVMAFTETKAIQQTGQWEGTPADLLDHLDKMLPIQNASTSSVEWPQNAIALSKRLNALKASLLTQNISVELSRGKQRTITLRLINHTIPDKQPADTEPKQKETPPEEDF